MRTCKGKQLGKGRFTHRCLFYRTSKFACDHPELPCRHFPVKLLRYCPVEQLEYRFVVVLDFDPPRYFEAHTLEQARVIRDGMMNWTAKYIWDERLQEKVV